MFHIKYIYVTIFNEQIYKTIALAVIYIYIYK